MIKRVITIALWAITIVFADAQVGNPEVVRQGPIVTGHCAKWAAPLAIEDSGVAC